MARVHIRNADNNGNYSVIVHDPIAAGSNSAGFTWKDAYLEHKKQRHQKDDGTYVILPVDSMMTEGSDVGQIAPAERAQVQAGDIIEFTLSVRLGTNIAPSALLELVNKEIDDFKSRSTNELKWYGKTNG